METIRYRVWDGTKMWYPPKKEDHVWRIGRSGKLWRVHAHVDSTSHSYPKDAVAMLSTGLRDQNGKEMWKDDIVMFHPVQSRPIKCVIEWSEQGAAFMAKFIAEKHISVPMTALKGYSEVMGNIYENPELRRE